MNQPNWTEILVAAITVVAGILVPGVVGIFSVVRRLDRIEAKLDKVGKLEENVAKMEARIIVLEAKKA